MFQLQRYFSIASLVSIAAATVALTTYYASTSMRSLREMGEHMNVDKAIMMSNLFGQRLVDFRDQVSALPAKDIRKHPLTRALDEEVRSMMRGHEVVKVKIYDLSGNTIYSSDPNQIGEDKSRNQGFVAARGGVAATELTHRDSFSAFEGVIEDRDVLSSYVPMRASASGRIEGVFEIYEDVTQFLKRISRARLEVAGVVTGVLALLYFALFMIVYRADQILRRQEGELRDAALTLGRANEKLESTVRSRTAELQLAVDGLRKLSRAVEQSPASIMITDRSGAIEYVNPKFCEVSGYGAQEAIGHNPSILKSGITPPSAYEEMWRSITEGRTWRGELCNRKKSGELFWEHAAISGLVDESGNTAHFVAVKEDITARKQLELELSALNQNLVQRVAERTAELEAANRELESFSYSVSHDLRAPLRAIAGFAAIVRDEAARSSPAELLEHFARIEQNVARMERLIDDLLDFSRIGRAALHRHEADMRRLVNRVISELGTANRVAIETGELPRALCDPNLITLVWQNLIGNALKYSSKVSEPRVRIGATRRGNEIEYFVGDNGAGFDPQHADKLFGVFQRLHSTKDFEGTGVGLAIVKRIVERHGGSVRAEGSPGRGATFYFTLPDPVA